MIAYQQPAMAPSFGAHSGLEPNRVVPLDSCGDSVLSVSTTGSVKTMYSRITKSSFSSRRSSITSYNSGVSEDGKKYRFDTAPKLVKTPWEADSKRPVRQDIFTVTPFAARPSTARPATAKPLSARFFQDLPREVYDCVLRQLEISHFSHPLGVCLSCYLSDLASLSLTSRAWARSSESKLYQKLWILLDDSPHRKVKHHNHFLRMKQLRRTLRDRPGIGRMVRELHVPGVQRLYEQSVDIDRSTIVSIISSLIMACPNLERFTGLYLNFDHEYDRITHALSTRTKLKEKVWILKSIESHWEDGQQVSTNARAVLDDGSVDNGDVFLNFHDRWTALDTLMLFGQGTGNLDYRAFIGTFRSLPSLRHLLLSYFDTKQFNDRTMAALPQRLHSLRLQDLPGLSERGLSRFANSLAISSLRSLSLVNLEISSARVIARILASTPHLKRFTLVQSVSPSLPAGADAWYPAPLYESRTLQFLHWDISPFSTPSIKHLSESMTAKAFPALRALRCPSDDGTLQALCRPRGQIARPNDKHLVSALSLRSTLSTARLAAQERLEAARKEPLMRVVVTDEDGIIQHKYTIKNYIGTVGSPVHYVLEADVEGGRDESGVVEAEDLFGEIMPDLAVAAGLARPGACEGPPVEDVPLPTSRPKTSHSNVGGGGFGGGFSAARPGRVQHKPRDRVKTIKSSTFF